MSGNVHLKGWLGIPARGCTSQGIFSPYLLGVKPVSQLYLEAHLGSYINSKLIADPVVKEALLCAEEREGQWAHKSSTIVQCKEIFESMKDDNFVPTIENTKNYVTACRIELPKLKKAANQIVGNQYVASANRRAAEIPFQGELLTLLGQEETDISWKSIIYSVPRGVMSWAIRSCTNSLATPDNLARWGKIVDPKCYMEGCSNTATLGHLLSNCQIMVNQGRYSFRHDSCLNLIYKTLKENKPENIEIYADLKDCKINGGTLPPDVALTGSRPDLVLVDRSCNPHHVILAELTVTWDTVANTDRARDRKEARYQYLSEDIRQNGYKCSNMPFEIGARGYISPRNRETLMFLSHTCRVAKPKNLIKLIGKVALLGSYQIYLARKSQTWSSGGLLRP